MIICYCAKCGEVIPDRQLERGEAAYHEQSHYCKGCCTQLGLTPMPARTTTGDALRHVPTTAAAKPMRASSGRLAVAARPAAEGRDRATARVPSGASASQARLRRASSGHMPATRVAPPTLLVAGGGAVLLVLALLATSGGAPASEPVASPAPPTVVKVPGAAVHALETELIALETVLARLGEPTEQIQQEMNALARRTEGTPLAPRGLALAQRGREATDAGRARALEALRARSAELTTHYQFAEADGLWEAEHLPAALRGTRWADTVRDERALVAKARVLAFDKYPRGEVPDQGRVVDLLKGPAAKAWRSTGPAPEISDGKMVLRSAKQRYVVACIDGDRLFKDLHLSFNLHLPSGAMRLGIRLLDDAAIRAGHTPAGITLTFDEAWERPYWWRVHATVRDGSSAFWIEDRIGATPMGTYAATDGTIAFVVQPGDEVHISHLMVRVLAEGRAVPPPKGPEPGGQ